MSDAAIANIVTGLVTITVTIVGFLTLWIKLKYGVKKTEDVEAKAITVEEKLDANTIITKAASEAAVKSAVTAARSATESKEATAAIAAKLNGGVDAAIEAAVAPLHRRIDEHMGKLKELTDYVHQRNHDMMTALQIHANRLETVILKINDLSKGGNS